MLMPMAALQHLPGLAHIPVAIVCCRHGRDAVGMHPELVVELIGGIASDVALLHQFVNGMVDNGQEHRFHFGKRLRTHEQKTEQLRLLPGKPDVFDAVQVHLFCAACLLHQLHKTVNLAAEKKVIDKSHKKRYILLINALKKSVHCVCRSESRRTLRIRYGRAVRCHFGAGAVSFGR